MAEALDVWWPAKTECRNRSDAVRLAIVWVLTTTPLPDLSEESDIKRGRSSKEYYEPREPTKTIRFLTDGIPLEALDIIARKNYGGIKREELIRRCLQYAMDQPEVPDRVWGIYGLNRVFHGRRHQPDVDLIRPYLRYALENTKVTKKPRSETTEALDAPSL